MNKQIIIKRFWENVTEGERGCWIYGGWGHRTGDGYFCNTPSTRVYAHRFAYECFNGPLTRTRAIDHLCKNKRCCRPDHLEAITRARPGIFRFKIYDCADDVMLKSISRDFWANAQKLEDGCWLYPGRTNHARRFAYYERCRPLPEKFSVYANCENIRCVRPDHLEYL